MGKTIGLLDIGVETKFIHFAMGKVLIILFMAVIFFGCNKEGKVVKIEDANFERVLVEHFELDDEIDGFLTITEEIKQLEELDLPYPSGENAYVEDIKNVDVIQYFENLSRLDLGYCNINNIDVSKNKKLEFLSLPSNEIEKIDLTQNEELSWINLNNNGIKSIDLSNNKNLEHLDLSNTAVASIDHSNNKNLKHLDLSNTAVVSIDLSKNEKLEELNLSTTNIKSLDLSYCRRIDYLNLNYCRKINSINIFYLGSLKELNINSTSLGYLLNKTFYNIQKISADNCNIQMNVLEFTNSELKEISLDENDIKNLVFRDCESLEKVDVYSSNVRNLTFRNCDNLLSINAGKNPIESVDMNNSFNLREFDLPYSNSIWHQELLNICYQNNLIDTKKKEEEESWNWNIILLVIIAVGVWLKSSRITVSNDNNKK